MKLVLGHCYSAKRQRRLITGLYNDREILWIGTQYYKGQFCECVQYNSPTVSIGSKYPIVSKEEF